MFKRKPLYSAEEITQVVENLERLSKLRDKALQDLRLYQGTGIDYQSEVERYSSNIDVLQNILEHMNARNTAKRKQAVE